MNYIDASIEMKILDDGSPKFEITLPQITKWACYVDKTGHTDKSGIISIFKNGQYWDEVDDFWKFRDIARDNASPFESLCIRGISKHEANYVFDEDKSVKWNRNAVIEYNKTVDSIQAKNKKFQKETDDVFNVCASSCIKHDFSQAHFEISQDEIDYIIAMAKERDYDYTYELVEQVEEYCQFYLELIKKRKNENN